MCIIVQIVRNLWGGGEPKDYRGLQGGGVVRKVLKNDYIILECSLTVDVVDLLQNHSTNGA